MNNLTFIPNALAQSRDVVLYLGPIPALIASGPVALRRHHINQAPATTVGLSLPDETGFASAYDAVSFVVLQLKFS